MTSACHTTFGEKEKAEENAYFNRQEQELLQKLVSRAKKEADKVEGKDHEVRFYI